MRSGQGDKPSVFDRLDAGKHKAAEQDMALYEVEITETLQKTVKVRAASADEAEDIVRSAYYNEEHTLDASNLMETDFSASPAQTLERSHKRGGDAL